MLTVALSKGRILDETLPLFDRLDVRPTEDLKTTRKLIIPTNQADIRFLLIRARRLGHPVHAPRGAAGFYHPFGFLR